ncbi:hypothetical protein Chor_015063 [Crotalus horridus]
MSRKKSPRAKGGSSAAPSSALPAAQQRAAAAAAASGGPGRGAGGPEGAANGGALPSRPSLSSSGEFHDVVFKQSKAKQSKEYPWAGEAELVSQAELTETSGSLMPDYGSQEPSQQQQLEVGLLCPKAGEVMLVGDSGVGKTCLLVRFKDGAFLAGSFISTVGIDFRHLGSWPRMFQNNCSGVDLCGSPYQGPFPKRSVLVLKGRLLELAFHTGSSWEKCFNRERW